MVMNNVFLFILGQFLVISWSFLGHFLVISWSFLIKSWKYAYLNIIYYHVCCEYCSLSFINCKFSFNLIYSHIFIKNTIHYTSCLYLVKMNEIFCSLPFTIALFWYSLFFTQAGFFWWTRTRLNITRFFKDSFCSSEWVNKKQKINLGHAWWEKNVIKTVWKY